MRLQLCPVGWGFYELDKMNFSRVSGVIRRSKAEAEYAGQDIGGEAFPRRP